MRQILKFQKAPRRKKRRRTRHDLVASNGGGLPSDFGAIRVNDGRINPNFDSKFKEICFFNLLYQQFQNERCHIDLCRHKIDS